MVVEELAPGINVYSDVFDASKFLELLEDECSLDWGYLKWGHSTTGHNGVSNYRTSLSCSLYPLMADNIKIERIARIKEEWVLIFKKIDAIVHDYRLQFNLNLKSDGGYAVLKYGVGGEYHNHVDHASDNARVLSSVSFLNTVKHGGELFFPVFNVTVKPVSGSIVLFPSNFPYTHIANPVGATDSCVKYSLVTWFK